MSSLECRGSRILLVATLVGTLATLSLPLAACSGSGGETATGPHYGPAPQGPVIELPEVIIRADYDEAGLAYGAMRDCVVVGSLAYGDAEAVGADPDAAYEDAYAECEGQ